MNNIDISNISEICSLHKSRIHNIYIFGSTVYGTARPNSDIDIIVVANSHNPEIEYNSVDNIFNYNIHVLTPDRFRFNLNNYNFGKIECMYLPKEYIIQENIKFSSEFKLEKNKLRHAVSRISSNSWIKCFKKLRQNDYEIGIKSLFHSFRIVDFGKQLCQYNNIERWNSSNNIYNELFSKNWGEEELKTRYKEEHNHLLSEFRLLCPKN